MERPLDTGVGAEYSISTAGKEGKGNGSGEGYNDEEGNLVGWAQKMSFCSKFEIQNYARCGFCDKVNYGADVYSGQQGHRPREPLALPTRR